MAKNVLELNGKRYDAITGAYLGPSIAAETPARVTAPAAHPAKQASSPTNKPTAEKGKGRVIDGFMRPTTASAAAAKPAKPKAAAASVAKPAVMRDIAPTAKSMHSTVKNTVKKVSAKPAVVSHAKPATVTTTSPKTPKVNRIPDSKKAAAHAKAHKPEKSKTLMRRAVHKPEIARKPAIKPQTPAEIAPKHASSLTKPSALQMDEERLERAKQVHQTAGIRHFQPARSDFTPAAISSIPRPAAHVVPQIAVHQAPLMASPPPQNGTHIFEAALARAESHKQPAVKPQKKHSKHRGLVNVVAGVAAFLVIAGFIGYLNLPNMQLRIASVQAGFTANMPAYKPDGYAMRGGVQRIGNTVSMRFTAGDSTYTITQQPSDWNSQTLVDNTVALANGRYKAIQAGGRNVYVYGGSNAVWVDGGVRYDLTTNASLSTDDITQLAAGL